MENCNEYIVSLHETNYYLILAIVALSVINILQTHMYYRRPSDDNCYDNDYD